MCCKMSDLTVKFALQCLALTDQRMHSTPRWFTAVPLKQGAVTDILVCLLAGN